ncbi:MAG: hypothetical protein HN560_11180 [Anaerolineae bacterium]|jgi:hypothetical protein|nr:hypothetical protein [Anaerolineae bacterium]MBT7601626.1 hypothetical protein [Anaerolineae bacterium]MBT7988795.1 hypothetical protein [Anaerolineae bacterium]
MTFLRLLPVILSILVIGAHYLRSGPMALVLLAVFLPFLLFVKKAWVPRLMQLVLILGALEWVRTLLELVAERQALGEPWTRLAIILGVVALFTGGSALVFRSAALKERYELGEISNH